MIAVGQQGQNHHDRHHVGGHDANHPGAQIVAGGRSRCQAARRRRMAAPQQEARQREEHRDGQIEPAEQPAVDTAGVTGLERDVRDDDTDRRACPHPLDGG